MRHPSGEQTSEHLKNCETAKYTNTHHIVVVVVKLKSMQINHLSQKFTSAKEYPNAMAVAVALLRCKKLSDTQTHTLSRWRIFIIIRKMILHFFAASFRLSLVSWRFCVVFRRRSWFVCNLLGSPFTLAASVRIAVSCFTFDAAWMECTTRYGDWLCERSHQMKFKKRNERKKKKKKKKRHE